MGQIVYIYWKKKENRSTIDNIREEQNTLKE